MVVVVEAAAEREQHEQRSVDRAVGDVVAPIAARHAGHVRERVDHRGRVQHQARRHVEAPQERRHAVDPGAEPPEVGHEEQKRRAAVERHDVVAVEPAQLRVLREVGDLVQVARGVLRPAEPQHVRLEEAARAGRMRIARRVGVLVVLPMLASPPQRTALAGLQRDEREHELHRPARLVRAVREVAVRDALDAEHADEEAREREPGERLGERHEQDRDDHARVALQHADRRERGRLARLRAVADRRGGGERGVGHRGRGRLAGASPADAGGDAPPAREHSRNSLPRREARPLRRPRPDADRDPGRIALSGLPMPVKLQPRPDRVA